MNGSTQSVESLSSGLVSAYAQADAAWLRRVEVAVCPPYPYLAQVRAALGRSPLAWGAQDVCAMPDGAYTGEVSVAMLTDLQCRWCIVGHSERRALFGETDPSVAAKAAALLDGGLGAIACVGESLSERESGQTRSVLARQLDALVPVLRDADPARAVLAYEPVWAIGTGRSASPDMAGEVHAFIRSHLAERGVSSTEALRVLYGGSVKPDNARALFAVPGIDGGLIGGAALKVADFIDICRAAAARAPL